MACGRDPFRPLPAANPPSPSPHALRHLGTAGLLVVLKKTIGIRAKEADEFDGLDLAEHDLNAYPDFQQTTIKSYHLREA